jgi:flagellar M-ring protein FliF
MATINESLKNFASPRYITLTIVGVSLLVVFSFLSYRLSEPVMSTLYNNLSSEDSAAVVTELGLLGAKFEVKSGGSEIMVESPDVLKMRMLLAQKGLPDKANIVGYEVFDKESMLGTSNFVMNVNLVRALEGELSRTIAALGSIKSARVHLVIPRKDVFKRNNYESSASVVLTLNNLLDVPKEEAQAVRHLVSAAVPGLSPSKITIVDSNGRILAKARNEDENGSESSSDSADSKFQMEERYRNKINNMIEQVVGVGKVDARVTVDMSFERSTQVEERYDPDGQVARSTQTTESIANSSGGASGEVSVANELTGAGGAGGGSSENNQKTDEVTNFEISKTITNKINEGGEVQKVSVAVLVDGTYTKNADGVDIYAPRTDEQLDQIKTLVRSAVGYDEARGDKVDVINMQFSQARPEIIQDEGPLDWLKRDLDSIIKTAVLGIVAILTIMLVIKPLVNKAFDVSASDIEAQELRSMASNEALSQAAAAAGGGGGFGGGGGPMMQGGGDEGQQMNLDVIQSKIDYSPTQKVNDLIDNNPEETLSIIRSWLTETKG